VRGDHFSPDVRELIGTLAHHGVRFLLVGGEAVAVDGLTFDETWSNRVSEHLELPDGSRHPLHVIGLPELLRNTRAAGRHKDLDDVEHLEPLLSRRTP